MSGLMLTACPARRGVLVAAVLFLSLLGGALVARGEEADVYLKDGRRLHGDVTQTETEVTVNTPAGPLKLAKADVVKIVPRLTPDDEYLKRFNAIKRDDVAGHYDLAEWTRSIKRWDLLAKQCKYILGLDPNHANAKLLLEQAQKNIADAENARDDRESGKPGKGDKQGGAKSDKSGKDDAAGGGKDAKDGKSAGDENEPSSAPVPLLNKSDILKLKLYELSMLDPPEMLRVKFRAKRGQLDVPKQFVHEAKGKGDFDAKTEAEFLRKKPFEQLREIVRVTGIKFADQIEIDDDPIAFETFRQKIFPIVARGCSSKPGCHGSSPEHEFRLPPASRSAEAAAYTAFALIDATYTRYGPLLDRDDPNASVLLSFMLPEEGNDRPHPPLKRGAKMVPVMRSSRDANFDMIQKWISSLATPHPKYELDYALPKRPTTQPASAPGTPAAPTTKPAKPQAKPTGGKGPPPSEAAVTDEKPGAVRPVHDGQDRGGSKSVAAADDTNSAPDESETVYVTKTGEKYHRFGCSFLRANATAKTLKDAKAAGLKPCSRCKPPA